ncbi:hypothetical protein OHT76_07420 [Streptomyces sp. NBC_00287]|uniref:hypothetical protein n=1 Tax=Streptomyces sp. NBC_00287 TaxID=2975702 RepID=UPI002E27B2E9|nr:hypothetical protein [Streptomyces sp. NBC_00287]
MSPTYDVIVRVLDLEKFGPVHNRGSSHGGSLSRRGFKFVPVVGEILAAAPA